MSTALVLKPRAEQLSDSSSEHIPLTLIATMFKLSTSFAALAVLLPLVAGQAQEWGQCKLLSEIR